MTFDSRQKLSKVWSNMAFDTFNICQRRSAKAIFCAVMPLHAVSDVASQLYSTFEHIHLNMRHITVPFQVI